MKVSFLGTGTSQGVPVIGCTCEVCKSLDYRDKRYRCAIHLEINQKSLIIDTGPDFRSQVLRAGIEHLDAVLFTHEHKDHIAGLDDIRPFNFKQKKDMPVYGRKQVLDQVRREFHYVFSADKYPGIPKINPIEITEDIFQVDGIDIIPIPVLHHQLPVFGFRIGDFTYVTDANSFSDLAMERVQGTKVMVINALQRTPHISHFTLEEALLLAEKIGAEKTYFTHISHKLGLHREVSAELPEGIFLAYDGLTLEIS